MRSGTAAVGVITMLALLGAGYLAADAYDVAPGFVTTAPPRGTPTAMPGATAAVPVPSGVPGPGTSPTPLAPASGGQPVTQEGLKKTLTPLVQARPMKNGSVIVLDGESGEALFSADATVGRTPASVAKLVSAAAVATTFPLEETLRTRVVRGAQDGDVVLVAGGDSLLGDGYGDPSTTVGHAGLANLADDTVAALRKSGVKEVRLSLDDTFAKGTAEGPTWDPAFVRMGFTSPIATLGLASKRAEPYKPAPADPAMTTAKAFKDLLSERGITVEEEPVRAAAPAKATELASVESAPVRDILREALLTSDNAITEALTRIAASRSGLKDLSTPSVGAWVVQQVTTLGVPTKGVVMKDASGLGSGTTMSAELLARLLALALDGKHPQLASVYGALPVAGATGTLSTRFDIPGRNSDGRGYVRAKTGSLPGVASLAGTVETAGGRMLVYVGILNNDENVIEQRAALDDIGSALVGCGCA